MKSEMDWDLWARDPRQPAHPQAMRTRAEDWRRLTQIMGTPDTCADSYRNAAAALDRRASREERK